MKVETGNKKTPAEKIGFYSFGWKKSSSKHWRKRLSGTKNMFWFVYSSPDSNIKTTEVA